MKQRKEFTREFKLSILQELETKSMAEICRTHNLAPSTVSTWRSDYEKNPKDAFKGHGNIWKEDAKLAKYDDIDHKILRTVTENGQASIVELAKKIKMTSKAALYRLRRLENKSIILGYNALIDTNKLGYSFYKIDFYLSDILNLKRMFEFAKQYKNIVYRMRTIGGPDFEIEVMVKNVFEMKELINEIRKNFPNIESYRFHRFEYTIKQVYLPGEKIEIESMQKLK